MFYNIYDEFLNKSYKVINKIKYIKKILFKLNDKKCNSNILILMYHQVGSNFQNNLGPYKSNNLSSEKFENQLIFLKQNYTVVSLDELIERIEYNNLSKEKIAVITFDDGFRDNYVNALPLLKKYNLPATIYVTTSFIGNKICPYEYKLADIIFNYEKLRFDFLGNHFNFDLSNMKNKKICYSKLKKSAKSFNFYKRFMFLETIINSKKTNVNLNKLFMNWSEIYKLSREPLITIGAHTRTHPYLPSLKNKQMQEEEIFGSKKDLENLLDIKIKHFSYPYGGYNYTIKQLVNNSGFKSGVTTTNRIITNYKNINFLQLPRVNGNNFILKKN